MAITNQANYALRAMIYLAKTNDGNFVSSNIVAEEMEIPRMFLSRINMLLGKAGLVDSRRGAGGGVKIAKNPEEVNLYQVIAAIDGPLLVDKCLAEGNCQAFPMAEQMKIFFQKAQDALDDQFVNASLKDLIDAQ